MRRFFVLVLAGFLVVVPGAHAQGPDDDYIRVYNLIQEAEALNGSGAAGQALDKYREAHQRLLQFQKVYPDWNPKIIGFRLDFLAGRIGALPPVAPSPTPKAQSPAPAAPPEIPNPKSEAGDPKPVAPTRAELELEAARARTRQLQADKELLEAKLKEALAAQPPAVDPRELTRAQEQIKSLQKEADLLRVSLAEEKSKAAAAPSPDTRALSEARQALAQANLKVAEQTLKAQTLAQQKKLLEDKLALLGPGDPNSAALDSAKRALQDANRQLAREKDVSAKLAADKDALQARFAKITAENEQATAARAGNTAALESTRQALAEANRQLAEQTQKAETLAKQLLQNKLSAGDEASAALETARKSLQEANRQLARQTERAGSLATERDALQARLKQFESDPEAMAALRAENAILKKQVAELKTAPTVIPNATDAGPELAKAQAQIAALQSDKEVLRLERLALENHVQRLYATLEANRQPATSTRAGQSDRVRQLERQRDELDTRLTAALKELDGRRKDVVVARAAELEDELATLRARLGVLEARKVPFTEPELELLSQSSPKLAERDSRLSDPAVRQLSPAGAALAGEAQRCFAAGQLDKAEEKYLQALADNPTNVFMLGNLGAVQLQRNRLAEAEATIQQALALAPNDAYSLTLRGYLKYRQQKYDEALDALNRAAGFDRQNPQIQNYLGLVLSQKGLRSAAETAFRQALQLDTRNPAAHLNLAVLYVSQQPPSLQLARWHYQRALAAGHPRDQRLENLLPLK